MKRVIAIHVCPGPDAGGWVVRFTARARAFHRFPVKAAALTAARALAIRIGLPLVVHRRDGTVISSRTPRPSR
jgi:hypothetical protein